MKDRKFPKQFPRWIKKAGLKPTADSFVVRGYEISHFKGHGRLWTISFINGELDMSVPYEEFHKWPLGIEASMKMTATNEKEFVKLVKEMLWLGAMAKQLKKKD